MRKQTLFAFTLLILLTTIIPNEKIAISKFGLKKIIIENNLLIKDNK